MNWRKLLNPLQPKQSQDSKTLLTGIHKELSNVKKLIEDAYRIDGDIVTWETLHAARKLVALDLGEHMKSYPIFISDYCCLFILEASKGSFAIRHAHDCTEKLSVLKGKFTDLISKKQFSATEYVEYAPYDYHKIYFEMNSLLLVSLWKGENTDNPCQYE